MLCTIIKNSLFLSPDVARWQESAMTHVTMLLAIWKPHGIYFFLAIFGYLRHDVQLALTELSTFFKELCAKTCKVDVLERLQADIVVILCKLERVFPPSFFNIMVHLAYHLPLDALLAGPVQYRWIYPFERYLGKFKRYVKNKAYPEGSIAEAYIHVECLNFCSM